MNFCVLNEESMLISLIETIVNSLQLFHSLTKIILGWQGGAKAAHKSPRGRSLLPFVAGEQGVVASLFVKEGIKP